MPVKNKQRRAARRAERQERYRKRVPTQTKGMPQGEHLAGFKGTKTDEVCFCGGCHPNAAAKKGKVVTF